MKSIRMLMAEALRKMEELRGDDRRPYEDAIETLRKAIQELPPEDFS
ncbi:MAG: hypothetical protein AAFR84_01275 [Pseudomonadota bacterium]